MGGMPAGYDAWKTRSPDDDDCCEFCGVRNEGNVARGWQPDICTGECGKQWRDPDAEYEAMRDDARNFQDFGDDE